MSWKPTFKDVLFEIYLELGFEFPILLNYCEDDIHLSSLPAYIPCMRVVTRHEAKG